MAVIERKQPMYAPIMDFDWAVFVEECFMWPHLFLLYALQIFFNYTLFFFFIRTSNFGAEAERS